MVRGDAVQNKNGFTLIELLISIVIFAIVLLGLLTVVINVKKNNMKNNVRNLAVEIVNNQIEKLRSYNLNNVTNGCTGTCNPNNSSCNIITKYRDGNIPFGISITDIDTSTNLKKVNFTICWDLFGKRYSYQTETYINKD